MIILPNTLLYKYCLSHSSTLPILILTNSRCCNFSAFSTPMGLGTHTIEHICDAFGLHWTTGEAFINNNGTFARHFAKDPQTGATAKTCTS